MYKTQSIILTTALALLIGASSASAAQTVETSAEAGQKAHILGVPHKLQKIKRENIKLLKKEWAKDRALWKQEKGVFRRDVREARGRIKAQRAEIKDTVKAFRVETADKARALRADLKARMKAADTPEARRALLQEAQAKREAFRKEIKGKVTAFRIKNKEVRKKIRAKIKERISEHLKKVMRRLGVINDRFTKINMRIATRLEKMKADGMDTARAEARLDASRRLVAIAGEKVKNANAIIAAAVSAEKPREYRARVRESVKAAIDAVKEARKYIRETVQLLKNNK